MDDKIDKIDKNEIKKTDLLDNLESLTIDNKE